MAHECIKCGTRVKSSEDIVKGCPSCGHKLFKFINDKPIKDRIKKLNFTDEASKNKSKTNNKLDSSISNLNNNPIPNNNNNNPNNTSSINNQNISGDINDNDKYNINNSTDSNDDGKLGSTDLGLESFSDDINKSIEAITVEEQGIYELNLQNLLKGDEGVISDKKGNYAVDINSLFKKGKKEQDKD
ncbi:MAG: OapC/ArvC family zinc-ribbon domain-containing protein [Methanobacteriaceae archaeon]